MVLTQLRLKKMSDIHILQKILHFSRETEGFSHPY